MSSYNIVLITHIGDVVQDGLNLTQWESSARSMSLLDDLGVPISVLPGNHDVDVDPNSRKYDDKEYGFENYVRYFDPLKLFADKLWFGGSDPSGLNSFQRFNAGGIDFVHIALEWAPNVNLPERSPSPLEWAEQVMLGNPGKPVILSTHEYLINDGERSWVGNEVWSRFVSKHDEIFLVLCGHDHNDDPSGSSEPLPVELPEAANGQYHQVSINAFGNPVIEVMQNFQGWGTTPTSHAVAKSSSLKVAEGTGDTLIEVPPELNFFPVSYSGGDGVLSLITFDLTAEQIHFESYSSLFNGYIRKTEETQGQWATDFTVQLLRSRIGS